jgi:FkbM family methyltransferase
MSTAKAWLEKMLSAEVVIPSANASMRLMRESLLGEKSIAIYGAGGAGFKLRQVLEKRGIEVVCFIDTHKTGECEGIPIVSIQDPMVSQLPIAISSVWFVEIAHILKQSGVLENHQRVYPVPDILQLVSSLYDDAVGWPFFSVLDERRKEFSDVCQLWEDNDSCSRFARLLAYRLMFFDPWLLTDKHMPCTTSTYVAAEQNAIDLSRYQSLNDNARQLLSYQYQHPSYWSPGFMEPRDWDTIIDGGAWEGDTAVFYAQGTAKVSQIYAFEPGEKTFFNLSHNICAMGLDGRITIEKCALGKSSGQASWVDVDVASTSSYISGAGDDVKVVSIDDYVKDHSVKRVDVIKLDVEGADLDALQGAIETINRDKPDLAISIYHSPHHLVDIPLWIDALNLGYRFRLSHNQLGFTESVCLATAR